MLDLEKLLICDGRPTKVMIDYLVDKSIKKMIDNICSSMFIPMRSDSSMGNLISSNKTVEEHNTLHIACYSQYYEEVCNDIMKSINRYESFVKIDYNLRKPKISYSEIENNDQTFINITYPIILEINPKMKASFILNQELDKKDSSESSRTKI